MVCPVEQDYLWEGVRGEVGWGVEGGSGRGVMVPLVVDRLPIFTYFVNSLFVLKKVGFIESGKRERILSPRL